MVEYSRYEHFEYTLNKKMYIFRLHLVWVTLCGDLHGVSVNFVKYKSCFCRDKFIVLCIKYIGMPERQHYVLYNIFVSAHIKIDMCVCVCCVCMENTRQHCFESKIKFS